METRMAVSTFFLYLLLVLQSLVFGVLALTRGTSSSLRPGMHRLVVGQHLEHAATVFNVYMSFMTMARANADVRT